MNTFIKGCLFLLVAFPLQAEVYTWTDSKGVVHFSDEPHAGASEVKLPPVQSFSNPPASPTQGENPTGEKSDALSSAEDTEYKITILQPEDQETIRNNQGYVPVLLNIEPELKKTDTLQLIFDNKPIGKPQSSTVFSLRDIERGSHSIAIQAFNEAGEAIGTSETITFFMHRPRVGMGNIPPPPRAP